jgi:branched-chain amino acid aminotransferase
MTDALQITIQPVAKSRVSEIDFSNLVFGRSFADHMFVADYVDGEWTDLRIIPYGPMEFNPAMMTLHYGQAIFEGLKAYKNEEGEVLVFRPEENAKRFNKSAVRMCMPEVPQEIFMEGLNELLRLDAAWVPTQPNCSLYVRPFMFATDEYVGVSPSKTYRFIIFNCPVGAYYSKPVKVWVETQYIRSAEGGVGFAKNAGNYGGSLYPTMLAQQKGYDQLIWTDAKEHKYVEEAGTMNFMFVIDGVLVTSPTGDTILDGITRRSILELARDWGVSVEERKISVEELIQHAKNGKLQEAFGAGTAAVVSPICVIGHEGTDYTLPELAPDAFCLKVKAEMDALKHGTKADTKGWIFKVQ